MVYNSLFVAHGAPTLALSSAPANSFLKTLGRALPRPRAAVVISPHWEADCFAVRAPARFRTWHDFRGFPPALYQLRYEPPGDAALADRVAQLIRDAGLPAAADDGEALDHGAWVPLSLMYPDETLPVVQVSLMRGAGAAEHLALGKALRALAEDDLLVIGSGSLVHNLRELHAEDSPPAAWAEEFDDWLAEHLQAGDHGAIVDYRRQAPHAARAHPEDDHLMPLFVAMGLGSHAELLHRSFTYGTISMACYGFA
ncbi:MAG: dioxygenase [Ectothiorhodospiraceae bacterium]|nr:dioxygenase [Ectothiorhodospiraceae bacterium]